MREQRIIEILTKLKEKYEVGATNEVCSSIRHESLVSSQAIVNAIYLIEFHSKLENQKPNNSETIHSLDLPTRSSNCLMAENINSLNDLLDRSYFSLLRIPNFGKKSNLEIVKALCHYFGMPMIEIPSGVGSSEKLRQPLWVLIGLEENTELLEGKT